MSVPKLLGGKIATDDRGSVSFVNDFDIEKAGVKRCYWVRNHQQGFVRAWHGHQYEAKYITVIHGAAIIGAVNVNFGKADKSAQPVRYVLSGTLPQVLHIPAGYANGLKTLTADAIVLVFSTATVEESASDDVRFPAHFWDIWKTEER